MHICFLLFAYFYSANVQKNEQNLKSPIINHLDEASINIYTRLLHN